MSEDTVTDAENSEAEKPKPRRARKSAAKPKAAAEDATGAQEPADEGAEPKKATRTRRSPAKKAAADSQAADGAAADESAPAKKPARRTARKAKDASESAAPSKQIAERIDPQPAPVNDVQSEAAVVEASQLEKPARKPRTRKPAAKRVAAEAMAEAAAANDAVAVEPAVAAEEPAAVKKPAAVRKTAAAKRSAAAKKSAAVEEPAVSAQSAAVSASEKEAEAAADSGRALTEAEAALLVEAARAKMAAEAAGASENRDSESDSGKTAVQTRENNDSDAKSEGDAPAGRRRRPRRSIKAEGGAVSSDKDAADASDAASSEGDAQSSEDSSRGSNGRAHGSNQKQNGQRDHSKNQRERQQNNHGSRNDRNDRNDRNSRNDRNDRNNRRRNREVEPSVTREELAELKVADLRAKAAEFELDAAGMKKAELVDALYSAIVKAEGFMEVSGVLDILADGYGFVRTDGYLPSEGDCYVALSLIKRSGLRKGDFVVGQTRPARSNEKYVAIQRIISVNGVPVEQLGKRVKFADLTPVYPQERLWMEHGKNTVTSRVIDLVAPIGKGQRGLIVSPPKAGKTTILKDIAASISANNPEVHLMCLLIDERPEEVTDMQRSINGEVISSTFDMPADNHIACAEMVIERAKRLVENGQDVVILLDSITRLARAYNLAQPASGRVLSGGVDSTALYPPKKFLGAARNIENGGSLTILASALIDTGSKMDEVIFEEFKGTGNMELKLDRNLADRRIFPAIDAVSSGTRKEELLIDPQIAPLIWAVRRILANMNNTERATDTLIKSIKQTETNQEFLLRTARKAQQGGKGDSFTL